MLAGIVFSCSYYNTYVIVPRSWNHACMYNSVMCAHLSIESTGPINSNSLLLEETEILQVLLGLQKLLFLLVSCNPWHDLAASCLGFR